MRLILLIILLASDFTYADSPVTPNSYKIISENNKYVFVMLSPFPKEAELNALNDERKKGISEIRYQYQKSGMYLNDKTNTLLWSVPWYALSVRIGNDGSYLVRPGPWASSFNDEAVSFFKDGKLLKSYLIKDLVKSKMKVKRTVSHFTWNDKILFDSQLLQYYVSTLDSKHYVFDVTNGAIISRRNKWSW